MNRAAQGLATGKGLAEGIIKVLDKGKPNTLKTAIGASEDALSVFIKPKKGMLKGFISKVGKLAPFLGALGAAATLIGLFGKSPEVQRLDHVIDLVNDGFQRMEERFDKVEEKLNRQEENIKNEIAKQHFWTRVLPHINALSNTEGLVKRYFRVTGLARESRKEDFHQLQYNRVYSAINSIKNTFTGKNVKKLCKEVRKFTNEDRKTVLTISVDLFKRLVKGASHLDLIGTLLERNDVDQTIVEMEKLLFTVWEEIQKCDRAIEDDGWKRTWRDDLEKLFLNKNRK